MPQQGFVDLGGVQLHYIDWGGAGKPLVLLAGLGCTAQIYRGLAPGLVDRFRVVGLTRRGHGRSDRTESGYDLDTLVEDIRHFLDALGLQQSVLVGHSFAGIEMPLFAIRYPHRVKAIVYLDAVYPALDPEPDLTGDPVWSAPPPEATVDDLASREAYLAYYKRARPDMARIWCEAIEADLFEYLTIVDDGRIEDHHDEEHMNRFLQAWESRNPRYGKVTAPQLAVVPDGTDHPGVPLDATDQLKRDANQYWEGKSLPWIRERTEVFRSAAPTARIVELDSPHHYVFISREDDTLRAIHGFLAERAV